MRRLIVSSITVAALAAVSGCGLVSKIPGMGGREEAVLVTPPNGIAYTSDRALQVGDVVGVEIYKGLRSSDKLFVGAVTVGADGMVEIGKHGKAKVVGQRVSGAADAIGSEFRRSARTSAAQVTVHISGVNGTSIVLVEGGVARAGAVVFQEGMSVRDAIGAAGGKKGGAGAGYIYVTSRGVRKTLVLDGMAGDLESERKLKAGDVVEVPAGM